MKPTNGKKPRTGERDLMVLLRNGWKAGPYKAAQLIWTDRGQHGDVVAVSFADKVT